MSQATKSVLDAFAHATAPLRPESFGDPCVAFLVALLAGLCFVVSKVPDAVMARSDTAGARRTSSQRSAARLLIDVANTICCVLVALRTRDSSAFTPSDVESALGVIQDAGGLFSALVDQLMLTCRGGPASAAPLHAIFGILPEVQAILASFPGVTASLSPFRESARPADLGQLELPAPLLTTLTLLAAQLARVFELRPLHVLLAASANASSSTLSERVWYRITSLTVAATRNVALALEASILGSLFCRRFVAGDRGDCLAELKCFVGELTSHLEVLRVHESSDQAVTPGTSGRAIVMLAISGILAAIAELTTSLVMDCRLSIAEDATSASLGDANGASATSFSASGVERTCPLSDGTRATPQAAAIPPSSAPTGISLAPSASTIRSQPEVSDAAGTMAGMAPQSIREADVAAAGVQDSGLPAAVATATERTSACVQAQAASRSTAAAMTTAVPLLSEASAKACLEAAVLRAWISSPAYVCWLAWFGHACAGPGALPSPDMRARAAEPTAEDEPRNASSRGGGCAPFAIFDRTGGGGDSSSSGGDVGSSASTLRVDSAVLRVDSAVLSQLSSDNTVRSSTSVHRTEISALSVRADGSFCLSSSPSTDTPISICAAVPLDGFHHVIEEHVGGLKPVLALATRYNAYAVHGRGLATCAVAAAEPEAPNVTEAMTPHSALLVGATATIALQSESELVVPLAHFDRFVRSCAEPTAQAAWRLQAIAAVRAAVLSAFEEAQSLRMSQQELVELLACGRLAASVALAASAALLPSATAILASAYSAYAHGGCPGAWAGFLPRQQVDEMLLAQAALEGPGVFLSRLSSSRACEIVLSYVASSDGGLRVVHELMDLSQSGNGVALRGVEYPAPAQALCASRSFLKSPCHVASLAVVGWAMPAFPIRVESSASETHTMSSFTELVARAGDEATVELMLAPSFDPSSDGKVFHVGGGLPFLALTLYRDSLVNLAPALMHATSILQLVGACERDQGARGRFCLPATAFERMRRVADNTASATLAQLGVSSPAALAATAWAGPLAAPSVDLFPAATYRAGSSKILLHRYEFSGFHASLIYEQTLARLSHKPPGSYLLRASQSQRSSVVLAFVDSSGKVQQSIISPVTSAAGTSTGKVVCSGATFVSLLAVLQAYSIAPSDGTAALLKSPVSPASENVKWLPVAVSHVLMAPQHFECRI